MLGAITALAATTSCTYASQTIGQGPPPGAAATAFDVTSIERDDEIAALVPAAVAADGILTVGSELGYAPMEMVGVDGQTAEGLDIDIITAVARLMGLEPAILSSNFDSIIPGIGTRYEVGMSAFTVTPERLDAVAMVSYFRAGSQLAVQAGNPADVDPDHLCGLSIGVQIGTTQLDDLEAMNSPAGPCADNPIAIQPFDNQTAVSANLAGGRFQAMYADSPVTAYAVAQSNGTLEALGEIRDSAPYGVVVARDDPELAEAVRAALQRLIDDGSLRQIAAAWGNADGVAARAEIDPHG